jgi:hypothetical protein
VAVFQDRVAIVDPINPPTVISNSIAPMLAFYSQGGLVAGQIKVFRDILFLPIVTPGTAASTGTVLTCRLNRPVQARQLYYPWTEFDGHAGEQIGFDVYTQASNEPTLLGGGDDGRFADFGALLDGRAGADANGVVFKFEIELRHLPTGQGQPSHLKRIRVRYTLASNSANPNLTVAYNPSADPTVTTGWVSLGPLPLSEPGADPVSWWLPIPARLRYVRIRLTLTDGTVETFVVQRVELGVRTAAHAR